MSTVPDSVESLIRRGYDAGFVTLVEADTLPPGLNEDVVRVISAKKDEPQWMTDKRFAAYQHWLGMDAPNWAHLKLPSIDFQTISYYSAPKRKGDGPKSLDEIDPELLETYNKLGIPLEEQKALAGIAVLAGGWWLTRPTPLAVTVHEITRGRVEASIANTRAGEIEACQRTKMSTIIGGRIETLTVREGDRVEAGHWHLGCRT